MKVEQILESDWENSPISDKNVIRAYSQRERALRHRRTIMSQKLEDLQTRRADADTNSNPDGTKPWDWKNPVGGAEYREQLHRYQTKIKDIDTELNALAKKAVGAKINMKYAKHDAELALRHAQLRGAAYPEGEAAMATKPNTAFEYAVNILKKRWPEGEAAIKQDPDLSYQYHAFLRRQRQNEI